MLTISKELIDCVSSKVNTWTSLLNTIIFKFKEPTPYASEEMGARNPIYLAGGYFFRELPDYVPNLKVIPGAWAEVVHKASGTLHRVYFETALVKDLIKVDKHGVQPLVDLDYTQTIFKEKLVAAVKADYILKDAWFNTDIKEEHYNGFWGKPIIFSNGLNVHITVLSSGIKEEVIHLGSMELSGSANIGKFCVKNPFGTSYKPTKEDINHVLYLLRELMRKHGETKGPFNRFVVVSGDNEYTNLLDVKEEL